MKFGEGDPELRHLDRAWAATIHANQDRTLDQIIVAMPSGNANLVNQKSLYVAISRARDRADLVTDDPKRLADQLEQATGRTDRGARRGCGTDSPDGREARRVDPQGQETERIEIGEFLTGHETGLMSPDPDEERTQESTDAGQLDQELADERSEDRRPESEPHQEKTQEPVQQPLDPDLGL